MLRVPRFPRALVASLLCLLFLSVGCRAGEAEVAAADPVKTKPAASLRGGVRYDPAAPLAAEFTPRFDPANPPTATTAQKLYSVRFAGGDRATVPAFFMVPAGAKADEKLPVVLLLHGLGGSKTDVFLLQVALARRGYATLAPDVAGHGERPRIEGKPLADLALPQMRQVAAQTVADLRRAVDLLETRPEIDPERIGFIGISLGGILGSVFAGDETRIKAVALWAAGGDWASLIGKSKHPFAASYRNKGATDPVKIAQEMADVEPTRVVGGIAGRPLLLLNGDKDEIVPRVSTDALFAAAKEPKRIKFLPGGHIPDVQRLLAQTLEFLDANLKPKKQVTSAAK